MTRAPTLAGSPGYDVAWRCEACGQSGTGVLVHTCSPQVGLRLTLPEPPSANRWWRRAGTHVHLSNEARAYKKQATEDHKGMTPLDGPVCVSLAWYRSRRSGDLDKRIGVILDALQGIAYRNDAQIVWLEASRHEDKTNPRVEATITAYLEGRT